jgi:SAM-dependent methyltransferase
MSAIATHRIAAALFAALTGLAQAQSQPATNAPPAPFEPRPGQQGKDVIWLPTPDGLVTKMLDLAKVTTRDVIIDLGSGDGRTVIAAGKRGIRALGIEYNPEMVEFATRAAQKEGVADKVKFVKADLFETDFSEATVITMYLLSSLNLKLRPKILGLKAGTRIVSHAFDMNDWKADDTTTFDGRHAYLWIVPAQTEGRWRSTLGELVIKQNFQFFEGTLQVGGKPVEITNGRINGDRLSFTAGLSQYSGRVSGNRIEGAVSGAASGTWSATLHSDNPVSSPQNH